MFSSRFARGKILLWRIGLFLWKSLNKITSSWEEKQPANNKNTRKEEMKRLNWQTGRICCWTSGMTAIVSISNRVGNSLHYSPISGQINHEYFILCWDLKETCCIINYRLDGKKRRLIFCSNWRVLLCISFQFVTNDVSPGEERELSQQAWWNLWGHPPTDETWWISLNPQRLMRSNSCAFFFIHDLVFFCGNNHSMSETRHDSQFKYQSRIENVSPKSWRALEKYFLYAVKR